MQIQSGRTVTLRDGGGKDSIFLYIVKILSTTEGNIFDIMLRFRETFLYISLANLAINDIEILLTKL